MAQARTALVTLQRQKISTQNLTTVSLMQPRVFIIENGLVELTGADGMEGPGGVVGENQATPPPSPGCLVPI